MRNNSIATATYIIVRERGKVQIIVVASAQDPVFLIFL